MSPFSTRLHDTDASPSAMSNRTTGDFPPEIAVDKFTHFALNSHHIPLGSMTQDQWLDILDAIDAWLRIGGGFSVHSAECLLERLIAEHAATHIPGLSQDRTRILFDAQLLVLQSWVECFRGSESSSHLALIKAQRALERRLELPSQLGGMVHPTKFPLEEFVAVVGGFLTFRTQSGSEGAGHLLLQITGDMDEIELNTVEYACSLGPLFEDCAIQLLEVDMKNDLALDLLERMRILKENRCWRQMEIPDVAERMLLESSLDQITESNQFGSNDVAQLSSFEQEAIERRLIDVVTSANESDDVQRIIQKMSNIQLNAKLITALIEFYLRVGDVESAAEWLQKLDTSSLVSSNLIESIIESWRAQSGTRVVWRVDEVFKNIFSKVQREGKIQSLNTQAFYSTILMWSTSGDTAADRKIVDWYSQMKTWEVQPDTATLTLILHAAVRGGFEGSIQFVAKDLSNRWKSLEAPEKEELVGSLIGLASLKGVDVATISFLMDGLRTEEVLPKQQLCRTFLSLLHADSASASDVMKILNSFGNTKGDTDLSLFALAIQILFKVEQKPVADVESVYDRALGVIQEYRTEIDDNDISQFIDGVIAMHVHRKLYSEAGSCLQKAENKLLANPESSKNVSIIPLECYKRLIVRKWYTVKTAPRVERTFERLTGLYRSGYFNLKPDCEIYAGYIRALSACGKDVETPLNEMIEMYKANGTKSSVPSVEPFNVVLLSYGQGKEKTTNAGEKSIALFNRMITLGVDPDIKTLNFVLKNVIRGSNQNPYVIVSGLMARVEAKKMQHNSFTLHFVLEACGSAHSGDRESALKKCLSTLGEIREKGYVGRATYGICSRVIYRLLSKGARADKVAVSVMSLCREDGWFDSEVRDRLQSLMSPVAWEQQYIAELTPGSQEPADWSRNIRPETSRPNEATAL